MKDRPIILSCEQLQAIHEEKGIRIVDCRFDLKQPEAGHAQYLQSHLPGAVFADLDRDLAAPVSPGSGRHPLPEPMEFKRTLERLGISSDTHVVAYDHASGALASRLWWLLRWAGHERVSVLDGGISRWERVGLPLEQGQKTVPPTSFKLQEQPALVLETEEIVEHLPNVAALRLVDAREADRFLGLVEPIDPIAGHIPGALNVPFASTLSEDGTWKAPAALRRQLKNALGDDLRAPWSVMCGSGVTACHLVVSALLAGLPEPRVYVGSWSEWIQDPTRPVSPGGPTEPDLPPKHAEGT